MTKRTTWPMRVDEGTTKVGTTRVRDDSRPKMTAAQKGIFESTGNRPQVDAGFDDIGDGIDAPPVLTPAYRKVAQQMAARSVGFTVDCNPVAKGRPRASSTPRGIRMHTPKATKRYEAEVQAAARAAMLRELPFGRPVALTVSIVLPVPASWSKRRKRLAYMGEIAATKKPDADNVLKAIKDGMNGIVYWDDSQVVSIVLTKAYGEHPRADLVVTELDKEAA
ncbi:RusA family crossover junction endodeoxyribonuclease [Burkholderia sp. LMG 13014]|uniref:RusA family crossover junction endodeoxyribonuclease n=1 Tax=Burkholderia sp. LMG 13014 TaxID=2709306 RepID=UPI001F05B0F8|nr:RusA family crossover junction endodeoxyribonuclease [Burkholderia sp. LMG 13014]